MEQWTFNRTYSGVPQGSGVSPVLANIYLHELDKFMENYAENFNTEAKKKHFSTAYKSSVGKAYRYRKKGREIWDSLSDEEKKIRCKNLKELEMIENLQHRTSITTVIIKGCSIRDMRMILSSGLLVAKQTQKLSRKT